MSHQNSVTEKLTQLTSRIKYYEENFLSKGYNEEQVNRLLAPVRSYRDKLVEEEWEVIRDKSENIVLSNEDFDNFVEKCSIEVDDEETN